MRNPEEIRGFLLYKTIYGKYTFMSLLNESKRFDDYSNTEQNQIFDIFTQSYIKATGHSWDRGKFFSRAQDWLFFGDPTGFVTVRPQQSGYYKLTGIAGNMKSILRGLQELTATNYPMWGMMTPELGSILIRKYHFRAPNKLESLIIAKLIPSNVFGNVDYKRNSDGSMTFNYPDVGEATKIFVGNDAYYKKARRDAFNAGMKKIGLKENSQELDEEELDEKRAVESYYQNNFKILIEFLKKYGYDDTYATFRQGENTSMVNKNNTYDTPTGRYVYPLKNFKPQIVSKAKDMGTFRSIFPFTPDSMNVQLFTLRDKSRVLFSTTTTPQIANEYVKRIKKLYSKNKNIAMLCRLYPNTATRPQEYYEYNANQKEIEAKAKYTYTSRIKRDDKFIDEFQKLWLFIYEIAHELKRPNEKYDSNEYISKYPAVFTKICSDIGIDGFVDDGCKGIIHTNEPCQGVFLKNIRQISDNLTIIPLYQRYDTAPKFDKPRNSDELEISSDKYKRKFQQYLGKLFDAQVSIQDNNYQEKIKERKPFMILANSLYYYVTGRGDLSVQGINPDEFLKQNENDVNDYHTKERTAYINTAFKKRYSSVAPYDQTISNVAVASDEKGHASYIDLKGEPADLSSINPLEIKSPRALAGYFNQLIGKDEYYSVGNLNVFGEGTATATKHDGKMAFINMEGKPDLTNVKPEALNSEESRVAYYNQQIGYNRYARIGRFGDYAPNTSVAVLADGDDTYMFLNRNGQADISNVDVNAIQDAGIRAVYYNQLIDEKKYATTGQIGKYGAGVSLAKLYEGGYVFINAEGQPDLSDVDEREVNFASDDIPRTALFNQKNGSNYAKIEKFGDYGEGIAVAKDYNGKTYFINAEGKPDIGGVDINKIEDEPTRAAYVNSLLGTNFKYVAPFGEYGEGISYAIENDTRKGFINKNGKPDVLGVDPRKMSSEDMRATYFNQKFGEKRFDVVQRFGDYGKDTAVATSYDGNDLVFINLNGEPDATNVDLSKNMESEMRAAAVNQKFKRNFRRVYPYDQYGNGLSLAVDKTGKYMFINKRGNRSLKGIDFDEINGEGSDQTRAAFINQKNKVNNFLMVKPFGEYGEGIARATTTDGKTAFINNMGQEDNSSLDPAKINNDSLRASMFNQKFGANFSDVIKADSKVMGHQLYFAREHNASSSNYEYVLMDYDGNYGGNDEDIQKLYSSYSKSTIDPILAYTEKYAEKKAKEKQEKENDAKMPEVSENKVRIKSVVNEELIKLFQK